MCHRLCGLSTYGLNALTTVPSALEVYLYTTMCYINRRFTYLITYLFKAHVREMSTPPKLILDMALLFSQIWPICLSK